MNRACYLLVLLTLTPRLAVGDPLSRPELQQQLSAILDDRPVTRRATVCLKVVDLATGEVLFDRGGDRLLTPASNLKIYTAACALDKWGPEKRFLTELRTTARIDRGTLNGDLVLVGGGDSMLTTADVDDLVARAVRQWGLQRVDGAVRVDNARYGSRLKGPGWMWDDDPDAYNMSVTPLMMDFNVLTVRVTASANGLFATLVPPSDFPPIRQAAGDVAGTNGDVRVTRQPFRDEITVSPGQLVEGNAEGNTEFRLTMHDPGPWAAGVLRAMLRQHGVVIQDANPAAAPTNVMPSSGTAAVVSMRHEGVTLGETISHLHHVSENAVGEVLLHEIAIAGDTRRPTWSDGANAITHWLTESAGLQPGSFRLVDGSGLSRYNLISADSSVRLLKYMHGHEEFDTFFGSLKTYAVDPKQNAELAGSDLHRVHAKSGGMTGVATISGYVRTLDGRLLAFSFLANGFIGSNAPVIELRNEVWRTLVRYQG